MLNNALSSAFAFKSAIQGGLHPTALVQQTSGSAGHPGVLTGYKRMSFAMQGSPMGYLQHQCLEHNYGPIWHTAILLAIITSTSLLILLLLGQAVAELPALCCVCAHAGKVHLQPFLLYAPCKAGPHETAEAACMNATSDDCYNVACCSMDQLHIALCQWKAG
jgi:hypothetical protein